MSIDEQLVLQPFERKPFVLNLGEPQTFFKFWDQMAFSYLTSRMSGWPWLCDLD